MVTVDLESFQGNESEAELRPAIIIEDDAVLLEIYRRTFSKTYPHLDLILCSTGDEGIRAIKERNPALIITDLSIPEIDGLQILVSAIKYRPNTPVLVISGFFALEQIKMVVGNHGNITFMKKPFDVKILNNLVGILIHDDQSSTISGMSPVNVLQMVALENKSCLIEFHSGGDKAVVSLHKGIVHYAKVNETLGWDALKCLSAWKDPMVFIYDYRTTSDVNIEKMPIESLLLRLFHEMDEGLADVDDWVCA